jgi:SAM-dependent methyltransferase
VSRWRAAAPPEAEIRRIVGGGYDAMGERFDRWADRIDGSPRDRFVARLLDVVPSGGRVLEIGCGSGARTTPALVERYEVTGIDVSARQIERARARLPDAEFLVADATEVELPPDSFAAVLAMYSLNHIPTAKHPIVYRRVAEWLRPGGCFVASLPASGHGDGVDERWLGVPMFFASLDADENLALLRAAGLEIVWSELVSEFEPQERETPATHGEWQWVMARRGPLPVDRG